jgi:hypothetical protein
MSLCHKKVDKKGLPPPQHQKFKIIFSIKVQQPMAHFFPNALIIIYFTVQYMELYCMPYNI